MLWSTESKAFSQQICHKQNYLHQELSLVIQLDWEEHRKLNSVVESEIVENILTYISQENHCYTSAFSRFYQNLVVPRYWSIV